MNNDEFFRMNICPKWRKWRILESAVGRFKNFEKIGIRGQSKIFEISIRDGTLTKRILFSLKNMLRGNQ